MVRGNTLRGPLQFHYGLRSLTRCELNSGAILGPFNPVYGGRTSGGGGKQLDYLRASTDFY